MPVVIFVQPDGARRSVDAPQGVTLMETARQNGIPGIVAQCGGACACATCHVYVEESWLGKLPPPEDMEAGMLDSAWEQRSNSRLSCQIQITAATDGLIVNIPARQA